MQINTNGQRNITLDFDAPKKFKLRKDGAEIPYIRTGKNSFRLGRNIDGVLDLEEVIEQPRIVKPMQLQAQQMALVNPNDVLMINQAAQQLEVEQNILGETQKRVEQTQAYLDIQQQRINESVLSVQGLETENAERITATENGIFNLAGELAKAEGNSTDADNYIISELEEHKTAENPHGITKETIGLNKVDNTSDLDKPISKAVQSALDEKADKDEIQAIRDELGEYQEKNDRFTNALSNYTGGLAGNQLPDGGSQGQILAKRSDMSGDAEWVDSSVSITIDDELSLESENPVQNKVITSSITALQTNKQDKLTQTQLDAVNSGANQSNIAQITANKSNINNINIKIPAQASSANQLADKDFVNSSIATNTATFRGTYNSVAELEAYLGEKDNNDYAFVTGVDSLGNTYYDNYVYNGTAWAYRWRLNNSSFTSAQWASINSGATTQSINQISTNTANINSLQTSKQDVLTSENEGNCIEIAIGGSSGLPAEYQEVEYLESSGTQYIDTGIEGNDNYVIKGKFYDNGTNCLVSGSTLRYGTNYIGRFNNGAGSAYRLLLSNKKCSITATVGIHEFQITPLKVIFDDVEYSWSSDTNGVGSKLYLFYGYYNTENLGSIRLYYYQVELNDVLLRNYIPCRRNSDNVLGMYDTVSQTFFTNAGTGTFIAGADVEEITKISFVNDAGYITSSALNGYATESYVTTAVSGKQDTLVSGTNIKTINGQSILGGGNVDASFIAVYGQTTFTEVSNAISAGKSVLLSIQQTSGGYHYLPITRYNSNVIFFGGIIANPYYSIVKLTSSNKWSMSADMAQFTIPSDLATVATSGSYNDLSDKPTIPTVPTNISAFTNDSGYITSSALNGYATKNYVDTSKADIDLSNITSTGKNIANWSTNVTNCITEIPQDIKLELNNGTLTLKAGSKVYVPNGAGVFDEVTISSDFSVTSTTNAQEFILLAPSRTSITHFNKNFCSSGPTQPTVTTTYWMWYDTTNNKIKFTSNSGASWVEGFSLPLGLSTSTSSGITSINQVFNGFGYFGKRNFITNVKLLIAKGYNTDGTYHNQEYIINSPIISRNDFGNNSIMFLRYNNGSYQIYNIGEQNYLGELDYVPNVGGGFQWYYNTTNRMWYMHEAGEQAWRQVDYANLGISNSTETNFKEVFRAVDYDDVVLKQDLATVHCVVETYVNGTSWYRVYDDGWCEQGGFSSGEGAPVTITLLKPYKDTNYSVVLGKSHPDTQSVCQQVNYLTTTSFVHSGSYNGSSDNRRLCFWVAYGFIN